VATNLIWAIWHQSDDDRINDLMRRGLAHMSVRDYPAAIKTFGGIIDLEPGFAEAWNKRATVYYLMGDYRASVHDIDKTLELEPRHFGALSGLGLIHTALGDPGTALYWFREALKQNPHIPSSRERADDLANVVDCESI